MALPVDIDPQMRSDIAAACSAFADRQSDKSAEAASAVVKENIRCLVRVLTRLDGPTDTGIFLASQSKEQMRIARASKAEPLPAPVHNIRDFEKRSA